MDITVTNTGKVPGKEVVLVFAQIPDGKLEQPSRRLVAFAKTDELAPGASQIIRSPSSPNASTPMTNRLHPGSSNPAKSSCIWWFGTGRRPDCRI